MGEVELQNYGVSPAALVIAGVGSVLIGALLLMGVVRWTEGFSISFAQSIKVTVLGIVAALVSEFLVFAVLLRLGYSSLGSYAAGLVITTVLLSIGYTALYAYMIKRPTGEHIGIARAIKVTVMQLALTFAAVFVVALIIAILILNGVIAMPELPMSL